MARLDGGHQVHPEAVLPQRSPGARIEAAEFLHGDGLIPGPDPVEKIAFHGGSFPIDGADQPGPVRAILVLRVAQSQIPTRGSTMDGPGSAIAGFLANLRQQFQRLRPGNGFHPSCARVSRDHLRSQPIDGPGLVEGGDPVPEAAVDDALGGVEAGGRLSPVVHVPELAVHHPGHEPSPPVRGLDRHSGHPGHGDPASRNPQPEGVGVDGAHDPSRVVRGQRTADFNRSSQQL